MINVLLLRCKCTILLAMSAIAWDAFVSERNAFIFTF